MPGRGDGEGESGTRWLDADEQAAWRSFIDGVRVLVQGLDRQLQDDHGISLTDYELLVRLSEAPGRRLRMGDLATALLATRSGATRAVGRLEAQGRVRRVSCADDRRGMWAELTPAGLAVLEAAAPGHVEEVRRRVFDGLADADVVALGALGRRLAAAPSVME